MKKYVKHIICAILALAVVPLFAACGNKNDNAERTDFPEPTDKSSWQVASPDGSIKSDIVMNAEGKLLYSVKKGNTTVVDSSSLGMSILEDDFRLLDVESSDMKRITGSYENKSGKHASVNYDCNELTLTFKGWSFYFDVVMRCYDDGYAFRYNIRAIDGSSGVMTVESENSEFALPENSVMWTQVYKPIFNWVTSFAYEEPYVRRRSDGVSVGEYLSFPTLYRAGNSDVYSLLTESELIGSGYYGSYLTAPDGMSNSGVLQTVMTPAGVQTDNDRIEYPFSSPWRVGITGDLKTVVESELTEKLYDDSASALWTPDGYEGDAEDYWDWVDPGVTAWSWLYQQKCAGSDYTTVAGTVSGKWHQENNAIHRDYVDLAAEMGWKYVLLDGGWNQDQTQATEFMKYAHDKGIGVFVWCDALNSFSNGNADVLKTKLDKWKALGVDGIKIDFFDGQEAVGNKHQGEDVDTIKWYETVYQECAKRQMLVNPHGCNKPTGERRKYPNVINREAVYGGEKQNIPSSYTVMSMYTRGVVGPTDFTPMVKNMASSGASMIHNMALATLYESGAPSFGDWVAEYRDENVKSYYAALKALHDDTVFLCGTPDRFYCAAIKMGDDWFVACINGIIESDVSFDFGFLEGGTYSADIYTESAKGATEVTKTTESVTSSSNKTIKVFEDGGFVIHLKKQA